MTGYLPVLPPRTSTPVPPFYLLGNTNRRYFQYFIKQNTTLTASCYSIDSDRLHRCCHLPNNFGSRRVFPSPCSFRSPCFTTGRKMFPSQTRGSGSPLKMWFLGLTPVHTPNGISIGSAVIASVMVLTNRHLDHEALTAIGRIMRFV